MAANCRGVRPVSPCQARGARARRRRTPEGPSMTVKTDRLITLFGGGGFVGRYVAQALFMAGARVRIAGRDPRSAFYLKPLTGLGMIQFLRADIRSPGEVARSVQDADSVINLVGILSGDFDAIHVEGARNVASASA